MLPAQMAHRIGSFFFPYTVYHTADNFTGTQSLRSAGRHGRLLPVHCSDPRPFSNLPEASVRSPTLLLDMTDICTVKACCFKKHCLYIICNHGVLTTHDSGNTDWLSRHRRSSERLHPAVLSCPSSVANFSSCFCTSDNNLFDLQSCPDHKHALAVRTLPLHSL